MEYAEEMILAPPTVYSVLMLTPVLFVGLAFSALQIALASFAHQLALHAIIYMLEANV